jgi:hypothetical protein
MGGFRTKRGKARVLRHSAGWAGVRIPYRMLKIFEGSVSFFKYTGVHALVYNFTRAIVG